MGITGEKSGRSLIANFVGTARGNWQRRCISDSTGKRLSYGQTLTAVVALSSEIAKLSHRQGKVGILLPPSVGAVLANLSVTFLGKVTVNLNYTSSEKLISAAREQSGVKTVISSRAFVERVPGLSSLPGLVYLEDIAAKIRRKYALKAIAYLKARFMPLGFLTGCWKNGGDDLATVIFSSGSSGRPKGVMLSHNNILSSIASMRKVFAVQSNDNFCGVLPFFHCFGFTCTLWLPLLIGISASYVANPLDGAAVGSSVRRNHSTVLFAAPTFLLNYAQRVDRADFESIRMTAAGGEKLRKHTAEVFEEKFGIKVLEGYGATELSPVVAINMTKELSTGLCEVGVKEATVGRVIPGVQVKIVSSEDGRELGVEENGILMVKGPNVMLGYLDNVEATASVLHGGWYNTGDIARIDAEGFLTIVDRLSRFSKIGGEMVPHVAVEEVFLCGLGTDEQLVAVTGIPDRKKGEQLVVLHIEKAGDAKSLQKMIEASELPNMWKPTRRNYIQIESMPALGSGKLDILRLRQMAAAAME